MQLCAKPRIRIFDFDLHICHIAELFDHGKANACACGRAGHFIAYTVKFFEDVADFLLRNARTVVAYHKIHIMLRNAQLQGNHLICRISREFERIVHDVCKNLHHRILVESQLQIANVACDSQVKAVLFNVLRVRGNESI